MRILLDENIPRRIKFDFNAGTEVHTVQEMNWSGKKNGELLGLATFSGFDCFITMDKNLQFQQNLKKFSIYIIILDVADSKYQTIQPVVRKLIHLLSAPMSKQIVLVS
jgi:predicted nuclease of predicted toxin-antitoxin system